MEKRVGSFAVVTALVVTVILVLPGYAAALPPSSWKSGQEKDITGHTFSEEYWTKESITNTTADGHEADFSLSYVNSNNVQAFLVALNTVKKNTTVGTLPWQLFGMHYYTKGGSENFIAAVLAFLLAYNDTNGNGMPDVGSEPTYYVIPFGVSDTLKNVSENFVPQVTVIPAEKLGDGHYRFGMKYRNLYAKVVDASNIISFWLSAALPLYIARFSELTVTYDITIDPKSGKATAETFYTIGQIDRLYLWGKDVGREWLPDEFGIAAVHYVTLFASRYSISGSTSGSSVGTGITKPLDENLTLSIGKDQRAMEIGYRGTFDLKNESSGLYVAKDRKAYNALVAARPGDNWLVAWQAGFSLDVLSLMAYGLSNDLQARYKSPAELYQKARGQFSTAALWYGVAFPSWKGYRVEHDPTYTAFIGEPPVKKPGGCGSIILVGAVALVALPAMVIGPRRPRFDNPRTNPQS